MRPPEMTLLAVRAEAGDGFTRIGELAKKYGVTLRTLRFYEDKGLLTPQARGHDPALCPS